MILMMIGFRLSIVSDSKIFGLGECLNNPFSGAPLAERIFACTDQSMSKLLEKTFQSRWAVDS